MARLVASGDGANLSLLQSVANNLKGSGILEFDIDTQFDIPGPNWLTGPDIKIGGAIKAGVGALEVVLKRIPGVHLDHGIEWTQLDGHGILRIEVRNNPVPLVLGPVVLATLPWLLKFGAILVGLIISWKLIKGDVAGGGTTIFLVIVAVLVLLFVFSGGIKGFKPPPLGG